MVWLLTNVYKHVYKHLPDICLLDLLQNIWRVSNLVKAQLFKLDWYDDLNKPV